MKRAAFLAVLAVLLVPAGAQAKKHHYTITSINQISPSVFKALQSKAGAGGPPGTQGAQGAPGSNGSPGAVGPIGPAGPMGATGGAGVTGATGPKGATGTTGPSGNQGPEGAISEAVVESATAALGSGETIVTANCPAGYFTTGGSEEVTGGALTVNNTGAPFERIFVFFIEIPGGFTARATLFSGSGNLVAYAVCAK